MNLSADHVQENEKAWYQALLVETCMPQIGIIATNPGMYEELSGIVSELGMAAAVTLRHANLNDALLVAREMEGSKVDVLVSRGTVVELMRNAGVSTPIVNIHISIQDIAGILHKAQTITGLPKPRIANQWGSLGRRDGQFSAIRPH
jgi:hypothetical protein